MTCLAGRWPQLGEQFTLEYISKRIAFLLPEIGYVPPTPNDGDGLKPKAHQRDGIDSRAHYEGIWLSCTLRNDRIRAATGVTFRPVDSSDSLDTRRRKARKCPQ